VLVGKITSRGQVTIPREVREKMRAKTGDFVAFGVSAGGVVIPRVAPFDRGWHSALASTLN
jgi:AbrB family looped-hinge helix DNA binding protein